MIKATVLLADDIIPNGEPPKIRHMEGTVSTLLGYGLWLLLPAGVAGTANGAYKLAVSDKSQHGGGSEQFKWMSGGVVAILLAGTLITILNRIAGG